MNRILMSVLMSLAVSFGAVGIAASEAAASSGSIKWEDSLDQKPEWYGGDEAVRVADNLQLYQRDTGGWPKNTDMAAPLTEGQKAGLVGQKRTDDSTIDNGATYTQVIFLARVHTARKLGRHSEAFQKGVDYLLKAQYENGGWPQYYPRLTGYYKHVTFNDNAMINVMRLLRDISAKKPTYLFVDEGRRVRAGRAVERGVECILNAQVVVRGRRTAWGAQHDEVTLAPAAARRYEPPSLSAPESVGIVRFLMGVKGQDARLAEAIESAVSWFEEAKLTGVRWVQKQNLAVGGGVERTLVKDPGAPPLWARFYEVGTNRPIFLGRDGVVRYDVSEIEAERRNGYQWYVTTPERLLREDYPAWQMKKAGGRPERSRAGEQTTVNLSITNREERVGGSHAAYPRAGHAFISGG